MTRFPRVISNIAVLFSLTTIPESTRSPGSFHLQGSSRLLILVLFKWPTFYSEFYQGVVGGLGQRASNISPLSYKTPSFISLLAVDNTTRTPDSPQLLPTNTRPHQVLYWLPLRQTLKGQNRSHSAPLCEIGSLSKSCTSQKQLPPPPPDFPHSPTALSQLPPAGR